MSSSTIANGSTEIIHRLDLDDYGLDEVPSSVKPEAKREVAAYLENQILREVGNGNSPVQGEGRFKLLDPEYARENKNGRRVSNLELEGDLLTDFKVRYESRDSFLGVGHTGSEVPKADGHNQLSSKATSWARKTKHPKRRYIPDDNQRFIPAIVDEIRDIIQDFIPAPDTREVSVTPRENETIDQGAASSVIVDSIFDDDVIGDLLEDAQRRRNGL